MSEEVGFTGQIPALNVPDTSSAYPVAGESALPIRATPAPAPAPAASAVEAATASTAQPSRAEVDSAIALANANLAQFSRVMDYQVDTSSGVNIARIRDSHTGEVLQQIPGPDILAVARMLAAWEPGKHMLLHSEA